MLREKKKRKICHYLLVKLDTDTGTLFGKAKGVSWWMECTYRQAVYNIFIVESFFFVAVFGQKLLRY